ncbi:uncharacterized protein [Parasteatoda tepidariorum]|uniref:uncharacterized protein n=1 Tax=Parasteatoda tepidariorum TaxID=114398 RepID=UPI001C728723|nr:uncharacterized protein LOC107440223 [Parasteatoda tepidariorum]
MKCLKSTILKQLMTLNLSITCESMERPYLNKPVLHNKYCLSNKKMNDHRIEEKANEMLDTSKNECFQTVERKFPHKLKSINNLSSPNNKSKKFSSKIPVLKTSQFNKNEKNAQLVFDSSISAADRRQKFQQSRQRLTPPQCNILNKQANLQPLEFYKNIPPCYYTNYFNQVDKIMLPSMYVCKDVLPPIKNPSSTEMEKNSYVPKKKTLLGEITHFPALCDIFPKPIKRSNISSVPRLPSIFPPPNAPPPSISNSLEKEEHKLKKYADGNQAKSYS